MIGSEGTDLDLPRRKRGKFDVAAVQFPAEDSRAQMTRLFRNLFLQRKFDELC
jgi:hypothetical protein